MRSRIVCLGREQARGRRARRTIGLRSFGVAGGGSAGADGSPRDKPAV